MTIWNCIIHIEISKQLSENLKKNETLIWKYKECVWDISYIYMQIYRRLERTIRHGLGLMFHIVAMKVKILTDPQALVARNDPPPPFFLTLCLLIYFQYNFFIISSLFP